MKKASVFFSVIVLTVSCLFIIVLATGIWKNLLYPKPEEFVRTKVVTPRQQDVETLTVNLEQLMRDESKATKIPMEPGEYVINMLARESEDGTAEEQFVIYCNEAIEGQPIYFTWISFDPEKRRFARMWDSKIAASLTDTITCTLIDLIGDRSICVVITGMNELYEYTMTVFKQNPGMNHPFTKIAELKIDGSIQIQETIRTLAYQQGVAKGQSFNITVLGHDPSSENILDQMETSFSYNAEIEQYEPVKVTRIPGYQAEQRLIREILNGKSASFEKFLSDLWYYVSPQGTVDTKQYVYFNPSGKEIIFFGDEAQQVYQWQNSSPTRYGINIKCQNISITTLRRTLYIELETLDSIKLRAVEDLRLKITVNATWDGSYRRAGVWQKESNKPMINPFIGAIYDGVWGKIQFLDTGEYTIQSGSSVKKGHYLFLTIDGKNLLELRPENSNERTIYSVDTKNPSSMKLSRVNFGTYGVIEMLETPITLALIE